MWICALALAPTASADAPEATAVSPELFSELPGPPDAGAVAFARWAERVAVDEGAWLGALWTVELDGDPTPERAARLCGDERAVTLVIEDPDTGRRWRVSEPAWDRAPPCPVGAPVGWEHADDGLVLTNGGAGEHRERWLGLRDGHLVEAAHSYARAGEFVSELEVRWDLRTVVGTVDGSVGEGRRRLEREGWIVTMGSPTGTLEVASTYVRSGGVRWRGEDDASLSVGASPTEDGRVRLQVVVHDDQHVAAADASAVDGVDRLEIWWASPGADQTDPFGEEGTARGLTVVPLAEGRLHTAWIGKSDDPLPEVSGDFERLQIALPADVRVAERLDGFVPLTVVMSDVDGRRGNTPTVIATSRFEAGSPATFGWIARHPGGGQFPPMGSSVERTEPSVDASATARP